VNLLATVLALLSAMTFAVSTSVQHQAAEGAPASARGALGLVRYLLGRPTWLVGQVLAVVGFAVHAAALHYGPIALVQPIVISGIVFAVPLRAAISRRLPSRPEVQAVTLTAVGLAVFLVASDPTAGEHAGLGAAPITMTLLGVALAAGAALSARLSGEPRHTAFLFGVASGVLFGLVAGLLKLTLQELADGGVVRMLTVWPTWALVVVGTAGVLGNQVAYRAARLSASMPVLNIVDGLVALGFGYLVFNEIPRHSPLYLGVEVVALVCVGTGLWLLARVEDEEQVTEQPRRYRRLP
jgi:drug/metabolite transporter (DMT)-like permease